MRIAILLISLLIATTASSYAQDVAGTWHGFQISRDKGKVNEYRITMDFKVSDDNVTGTMQVKSPLKGIITSSFSGTYDKKQNMVYLKEEAILTQGVSVDDARLCRYTLKVGKNSLKGTGRSRTKGYDNLELRLQRGNVY
jgi:hypothetical protein